MDGKKEVPQHGYFVETVVFPYLVSVLGARQDIVCYRVLPEMCDNKQFF